MASTKTFALGDYIDILEPAEFNQFKSIVSFDTKWKPLIQEGPY